MLFIDTLKKVTYQQSRFSYIAFSFAESSDKNLKQYFLNNLVSPEIYAQIFESPFVDLRYCIL